MTKPRLTLLLVLALLAGCAQQPASTGAAGKPAPPSGPPGSQPSEPAPAPAPAPEPEPTPPQPATAAQKQQAQALAVASALQLEKGEEDAANAELNRALALDPNNKLALNLLKQITEDPVTLLGKESFAYTVRSTDSMSSIAGRFLGDLYLFYALARYNRIAIPRQLAAGQTLRVPGKAPRAEPPPVAAPSPAPAAQPPAAAPAGPAAGTPPAASAPPNPGEQALRAGEAAERAKDLEKALVNYRRAASLDQPTAQAKADKVAQQLVTRYSTAAQRAFLAQNLQGAIDGWTQVLRIDPANERAQQELKRSRELKVKADKLPN